MKTLNIIGAGKLGKTLGYLFHHRRCFQIQQIINKTIISAEKARDFIGAGEVVQTFAHLSPADFYLLSVSDDQIADCANQLVLQHAVPKNAIVFHCSGALPAKQLEPIKKLGASIASVHPVLSFNDPSSAVKASAGILCGFEGDNAACKILKNYFIAIGMRTFNIKTKNKLLYHASLVMANNYVTVLMAAALEILDKAGISNKLAIALLSSMEAALMKEIFSKKRLQTLTGPIARGDYLLVAQEANALLTCDKKLGLLYCRLGAYMVECIKEKDNSFSTELIQLLEQALGVTI